MATLSYYYRRSNPEDGLQAQLRANPEEVLTWVDKAPLRLIGATLADMQGSGKAGDMQERLERRVLEVADVRWQTWWKKVQPAVKESNFFRYDKQVYSLAPSVQAESIPLEPVSPRPTIRSVSDKREGQSSQSLQTWLKWLWDREDNPPPGNLPPRDLASVIGIYPEDISSQASRRLIAGAAEVTTRPNTTNRAHQVWLELILKIAERNGSLSTDDASAELPPGLPGVLAQLLASVRPAESAEQHLQSLKNVIDGKNRARIELAAGIWQLWRSNPEDGQRLAGILSSQLNDRQKTSLTGDVIAAALSDPNYTQEYPLDRLIDRLRPFSIQRAILTAVLWAAQGMAPQTKLANYAVTRFHRGNSADDPGALDVMVAAAIMLPEGQEHLLPTVAAFYRDALQASADTGYSPLVSSLVEETVHQTMSATQALQTQLADERQGHETALSALRSEEQRLRTHITTLRAELASDREASKLDVRRDMLQAIASTLDTLSSGHDSQESLVRDVEASLRLALQAGDADFYGAIGAAVEFDSTLHQTSESVEQGAHVTVRRQGIRVPGSPPAGDLILLRARVNAR